MKYTAQIRLYESGYWGYRIKNTDSGQITYTSNQVYDTEEQVRTSAQEKLDKCNSASGWIAL